MNTRDIVHGDEPAEARAELLKERIYLSFTSLAVLLAMSSHSAELGPAEALTTLLITNAGTLLAVFLADVISGIAIHGRLPTGPELRHKMRVSFGAIGAIITPIALLSVSVFGGWSLQVGLRAAAIALVVGLVVVTRIAIKRVKMSWWMNLLVLSAAALLGIAVIGLELLAHG
ncbi:hypothetical protein MUN76_10770 [Leucobacter rhizosphaerae]|uniref:VIT family protein n=1 Tax=Leucobacter rhizosphaerae TaxID=2932245 RepID=A0ABY4FTA7_9MICO|nr:hypothetical protein [Leucobacter rhizosphaerae]UOQ59533.1 hypothetical protein MUN76_10770 [Leucobacter rhizosphaerae]